MEILDTHKFNEKLNIQPVSRERLMKGVKPKTPKEILNKSGYVVSLGDLKHGKILSSYCTYFYVTYEDMKKYNYEKRFDLIRYTQYTHESAKLEGTLIGYNGGFDAIPLSEFDDNMQSKFREDGAYQIGIYQKPPQQPYKPLDIRHSLPSDILWSYVTIWSAEHGFNKFLKWDTSNVKNMSDMFTSSPTISGDISDWDVSNIKGANEKLDIKPVTKGRLANMNLIENAPNWKSKLKTGDEAVITFNETRTLLCHFIRMTDFMMYYDNIILKDLTDSFYSIYKSKQCKDGFFVIPPEEVNKCTFIGLGYFKDDCMEGNANPNLKINELYRNKFKSVTLSESYFKNKKLDRLNAICLYADNGVNEKLAIQPISKDRLKRKWDMLIKNERGWKQRLKTGDVVIFDIENKDTYTIATFISHSDFVKYHYDAMLKLEEAVEKCKTDQGFFVYSPKQSGRYYFTFNNVEDFFDDIMESTGDFTHCWKVKAIYRYDNLQPQPFDENYLENNTVYKELATLLYLDKNLPNKKMKV